MTEFNPLDPKVRRTYLGASDIPIIMGESPWKSAFKLWEEKVGISEDNSDNHHIRRGKEFEPVAREKFESLIPGVFEPCFKRDERVSWMAANLDGYDMATKALVEIKCPSPSSFAKLEAEREIPLMYQYQICWQKHVSKADKCYFFAYEVDSGKCFLKEFFEPEGMFESLFEEADYFWSCVIKSTPPEGSERHYQSFDSQEMIDQADRILTLQQEIKEREKEVKELKNDLIKSVGEDNALIGSYVLEKSYRKGSVDYGSIPELQKVNLEDYRKPHTTIWRLK